MYESVEVQEALRSRVWRSIRPVAASLTALYLLFTISHSLLLPDAIKMPMVAMAGTSALLLFSIALVVGRITALERRAYPLVFLVMMVLSVNSSVHVYLTQDIAQTTNVMLVVLGAGLLVLARSWYFLTVGFSLITWIFAVAQLTDQPLFTHFAFALFSATLGSSVFNYVHRRDLVENHRLRMDTERQREEMEHLATHDVLTGLANRRRLAERLKQEIANAKRLEHRVGVLYIDLDNFKPMNDAHGHEFGDQVLRAAGRILREVTRETDMVCRLGGDEFAVLLTNLKERSDADRIVAKILTRFEKPEDILGVRVPIALSIGSAVLPDDTEELDELLRLADLRMYAHKESMKQEMRKLVPDVSGRSAGAG